MKKTSVTRTKETDYKGRKPYHRLYLSKAEAMVAMEDIRQAAESRGGKLDEVRVGLIKKLQMVKSVLPDMLPPGNPMTSISVQTMKGTSEKGTVTLDEI